LRAVLASGCFFGGAFRFSSGRVSIPGRIAGRYTDGAAAFCGTAGLLYDACGRPAAAFVTVTAFNAAAEA
jgi:hypothetical protein